MKLSLLSKFISSGYPLTISQPWKYDTFVIAVVGGKKLEVISTFERNNLLSAKLLPIKLSDGLDYNYNRWHTPVINRVGYK